MEEDRWYTKERNGSLTLIVSYSIELAYAQGRILYVLLGAFLQIPPSANGKLHIPQQHTMHKTAVYRTYVLIQDF